MSQDKYTAVWVSHTSINDFLNCPRFYYLKNVYRDPKTNHKIKLISPALALGQAVHEVIESLSVLPTGERFRQSLIEKLEVIWQKISGKQGGFIDEETESKFKKRAQAMLLRVMNHPGPLKNRAIKIKMNGRMVELPYYWISPEDNIILCGKIDWLEYLSETDSVHIIDFKTNRNEEHEGSLQLPIYYLLATNCQNRPVTKASYWYLEKSDELTERKLPDASKAKNQILELAKKIKLARQLNVFKCPHKTGCIFCKPYEAIIKNQAEFIGVDEYHSDIYILDSIDLQDQKDSEIL